MPPVLINTNNIISILDLTKCSVTEKLFLLFPMGIKNHATKIKGFCLDILPVGSIGCLHC